MRKTLCLFSLILFSIVLNAQNYSKAFPAIDKHIDSVLKQWNIPGLAIGIVHKDKLIYGKGFGYRDLERKLPVNTATTFPIASNTKLFTSVLGGILQEENLLDLDKPVKTYMPHLNFATEELNAKVSVRDMLSHRTGIPGYDALWLYGSWNKDSLLARLHLLTPRYALREGYIYNNVMYSVAGSVMEAVAGKSWENLIREKIFGPLGMSRSGFSNEIIKNPPENHSLSYMEKDAQGRILPRPVSGQSEALGPAGTIYSSVEDMSKWMIALLNEGKFNGKQVIPANAIKQTAVPQIISDRTGRWEELSNGLYGMGRIIQSYKGIKILTHTGSIDNFYSNLTIIPSKELAIFIVFNTSEANSYRTAAAFPVIDKLLGLECTDWSGRYRREYEQSVASSANPAPVLNKKEQPPYHNPEEYVGVYTDPLLGTLMVVLKDNQLRLQFKDFDFPIYHDHFDQFITKNPRGVPDYRLFFQTTGGGRIHAVKMSVYGIEGNFVKKR
jgi:CubicO group peptidase (beta-lactamase class C family)